MKFKWEDIFHKGDFNTFQVGTWRAKVPGGWLVSNTMATRDSPSIAIQFVYDPNWEWEIDEINNQSEQKEN